VPRGLLEAPVLVFHQEGSDARWNLAVQIVAEQADFLVRRPRVLDGAAHVLEQVAFEPFILTLRTHLLHFFRETAALTGAWNRERFVGGVVRQPNRTSYPHFCQLSCFN